MQICPVILGHWRNPRSLMLNNCCKATLLTLLLIQFCILLQLSINCKGKMKICMYFIFMQFCCIYQCTSTKIKSELKKNILNFGYGINYSYECMLAHSFDRFYVVTKFILPSIRDLNFSKLNYDNTCTFFNNKNIHDTDTRKYLLDLITFCKKIEPFVIYYKRLIKTYNNTDHSILKNEIDLILPQVPRKQKCGIITTLVSSFIGLAYEGISSFLHHK